MIYVIILLTFALHFFSSLSLLFPPLPHSLFFLIVCTCVTVFCIKGLGVP